MEGDEELATGVTGVWTNLRSVVNSTEVSKLAELIKANQWDNVGEAMKSNFPRGIGHRH
jgi:hypothetical protein